MQCDEYLCEQENGAGAEESSSASEEESSSEDESQVGEGQKWIWRNLFYRFSSQSLVCLLL